MEYLTRHYKHKSEQLQEQLDILTKLLNEAVPPMWRGRPRITIPDGNVPPSIKPNTGTSPNIPLGTIIPDAWRDLLNLANTTNSPSQIQNLIRDIFRDDPAFRSWWIENYGELRNIEDVYQRLLNGTVWQWNNGLGKWEPIMKPSTQTQFGQIGPGGVLIKPEIVNPNISNTDIPPFPWQKYNRPNPRTNPPNPPSPPGPDINPGFNPGNN